MGFLISFVGGWWCTEGNRGLWNGVDVEVVCSFIGGYRRTDRRDMMNLIASYLDLEFTRVDAVRLHPFLTFHFSPSSYQIMKLNSSFPHHRSMAPISSTKQSLIMSHAQPSAKKNSAAGARMPTSGLAFSKKTFPPP